MLDRWHEFYILLGTAAAALVALLFVAASIGAGYLSTARGSPTHTYTSPVIFHYTYVLFWSLVALIPINTDWSLAATIGVSAAIALGYSCFIFARVMRSSAVDLDDRLGYGASPLAAYAATLAASLFVFERSDIGPPLLAGSLILLLLINIRNAWDLMLYFAQRRADGSAPTGSTSLIERRDTVLAQIAPLRRSAARRKVLAGAGANARDVLFNLAFGTVRYDLVEVEVFEKVETRRAKNMSVKYAFLRPQYAESGTGDRDQNCSAPRSFCSAPWRWGF